MRGVRNEFCAAGLILWLRIRPDLGIGAEFSLANRANCASLASIITTVYSSLCGSKPSPFLVPEGRMLSSLNLESVFTEAIASHLNVIHQLDLQRKRLEEVANRMTRAVLQGGKILWCGNGGSASDAQHLAGELVGRFRRDRPGLASIALTANVAAVIGIANDYGFQEIFARQVEALCQPGDVFVGISTSGNSRNVSIAAMRAREMGAFTVAFTGEHGGKLGGAADAWLRIPSRDTARIQEAYMLFGHMLCDWIELAACISGAVEAQRNSG